MPNESGQTPAFDPESLVGKKFDDPHMEDLFRDWYSLFAGRVEGWHPDPDYLGHQYNWRAAFLLRRNPDFDPGSQTLQFPEYLRRDPRAIGEFIDMEPYTDGRFQFRKAVMRFPLGKGGMEQEERGTWGGKKEQNEI